MAAQIQQQKNPLTENYLVHADDNIILRPSREGKKIRTELPSMNVLNGAKQAKPLQTP